MKNIASFKTRYTQNNHLRIPKEVVTQLSLKTGEEIKIMIEKKKFDKDGFLGLFGIWKEKTGKEIDIYLQILRERENFGRGEVKL